jgi:hypothetical protein
MKSNGELLISALKTHPKAKYLRVYVSYSGNADIVSKTGRSSNAWKKHSKKFRHAGHKMLKFYCNPAVSACVTKMKNLKKVRGVWLY